MEDECETTEQSYRRNFYVLLDEMLEDFELRFNDTFFKIIKASKCLHPLDGFKLFHSEDLATLREYFEKDFDEEIDFVYLLQEHSYYKSRFMEDHRNTDLSKNNL